eukprot:Phypoly_transcript_01178.p1 GENE.Phypoly_transcript_01178~~Phypoly_transcript_01178.p1  ORF type:complete len:1169 (+),score=188.17 Phypoly_transcript_01178:388-3507(+)
MDSDTNRDVRKAALSHIRISKHTLPSIIRRTRDVKDDIRSLAFDILTKKVKPEKLTPHQRCDLINELLKDGTNAQKEIVILKNWLSLRFGNDVMQLCEILDAENNEEAAEQALKKVFTVTNLASPFVISSSRLDPTNSFFWRVFCEHLKNQKLDDALDDALPTLSEYCEILHEAISNTKNVFTLKQLLLGCTLFDTADEVGRAKLTSLLGGMLTSAPLEVVTNVTKSLFAVEADTAECIRLMVESISELMDPLEEEDYIKKLKENLKELQSRQSKGTSKDAGTQASIRKIEEALQLNERRTWIRCCTITEQLLENINKGLQNPMVAGLFHSVILPSVKHKSPEIRNKGMKLLGLFCLFDKEMATSHVAIFIQAVSRDGQEVKITAMKVLFDFLLAYNLDPPVPDSQASQSAQSIQKFLQGYFHSSDEDLRSTCVEGFAKLLLADVVLDSNILSQLIEQYYHPQTASLPRLRRCLHVFFHTYLRPRPSPNPRVRMFRKSIFSALKTFVYSSTSLELPLIEVANYLVNLLRLACGKSSSSTEETKLGFKILKQLKTDPNSIASPNLCKLLRLLRLDSSVREDVELLRQIAQKVMKDTEDKFVSSTLEKLLETIQLPNQSKVSPSGGNQKPSEPASPSPPGSPYFTESPSRENANAEQEPPEPKVANKGKEKEKGKGNAQEKEKEKGKEKEKETKPEVKTPVSKKNQKGTDKEKAVGDFFIQQKRAFAELDGFALEVEVTPKRPRKSSIPALKGPTTPLPILQAPHTVPRMNDRSKRVKFDNVDSSALPLPELHTQSTKTPSKNNKKLNSDKTTEKDHITAKHTTTSTNATTPTNKNKRKHTETDSTDRKDKSKRKHTETDTDSKTAPPTKPRLILSFTGFKGPAETALLAELQEKAKNLQMACCDNDGLDSTVTHVVTPTGRKTVKTITARLAGLWVVDPQWIIDSDKAKKILPEFKYGTKQQNCLFDGKSFYFSPAFLNTTPRSTIHNCKTFIELARGTLTSDSAMADYVMVPPDDATTSEAFSSSVCLSNKQFFALITV